MGLGQTVYEHAWRVVGAVTITNMGFLRHMPFVTVSALIKLQTPVPHGHGGDEKAFKNETASCCMWCWFFISIAFRDSPLGAENACSETIRCFSSHLAICLRLFIYCKHVSKIKKAGHLVGCCWTSLLSTKFYSYFYVASPWINICNLFCCLVSPYPKNRPRWLRKTSLTLDCARCLLAVPTASLAPKGKSSGKGSGNVL